MTQFPTSRSCFCAKSSKIGKYSTTCWNKFWCSAGTHRVVPKLSTTTRYPRPDHLLPSAAAEAKKTQAAKALPSDETTESESPRAKRAAEGKAKKNNSPRSSVELAESLPLVPRGRRVVRKRKAHAVEPPRYEVVVL
jgi:hypothetical protein